MSLNWLNTKMVGLFVGCAILFVGFAINDNLHIYKPLAKRFEWASHGFRGQATYGVALLSSLVRAAADLRYLLFGRLR